MASDHDHAAQPTRGVPADQGLSALGLMMQLAGSVGAAVMALGLFVMLFAMGRGDDALWMLLVFGLCIARSLYQRIAGTELLYGRGDSPDGVVQQPLGGLTRYLVLAVVQTAIIAAVSLLKFKSPGASVAGITLALLVWPVILGVLVASPRFRRFAVRIPVGEDKGFEGAAILMTVLGLCGAIGTGLVLLVLLDRGGPLLMQGPGVLLLLALVLLVVRSGLHVQAGLSGLRETSMDRAVERANRYASFGVISAFCAAGALMLLGLTSRLDLSALAVVAGLAWMLMAWPLIIRRFFSDRQFAELLAGETASFHRRAPDAGLTGLGWLVLGAGAVFAMLLLPQLVSRLAGERGDVAFALLVNPAGGSLWWTAGVVVLQLIAGFALVLMTAHHRRIAIAYGAIATGVSGYLAWPVLKMFGALENPLNDPQLLVAVPMLTLQLVLPIATLLLASRSIAPTARARFRQRAAGPATALSNEPSKL